MNLPLGPLRICFHELLESIILIDRLHLGARELLLFGPTPSRHAAPSASSKNWRPWWQPWSAHASKYQLWHSGDRGGVFRRQRTVVPCHFRPRTTAAATNAHHVDLVCQCRYVFLALATACYAGPHALVSAAAHRR
jgi:hypothetical protein